MPLSYGLYIHYDISTFAGYAADKDFGQISPGRYAPSHLDTRQWVRVAKEAGMDFAVLTAKHEAGFCLWPSQESDYSVAASRVKTDVVAEFVAACKGEGLKPGVHYSIPDAHNEGEIRFKGPVGALYFNLMKKQVAELHTRYPELRVQLFDVAGRLSQSQFRELCETVKRLNPRCLVIWGTALQYAGPPGHDGATLNYACDSVNEGWFWKPNAALTPKQRLYEEYVQCAQTAKAFLLNAGPDTTGRIPDAYVAVLKGVKELIARNPVPPLVPAGPEGKTKSSERLKQLKELYDQGLINKEAYERKSKEILDLL